MNTRAWAALGTLVAVAVFVACVLSVSPGGAPGFDRLLVGWPREQVRATLDAEPAFATVTQEGPFERYPFPQGVVLLQYDRTGRLARKSFQPAPGVLDRLRGWWNGASRSVPPGDQKPPPPPEEGA